MKECDGFTIPRNHRDGLVARLSFGGCLTSHQHAGASQGRHVQTARQRERGGGGAQLNLDDELIFNPNE